MRPSGARIKNGAITPPGLPGMGSIQLRSGGGFGIGTATVIPSVRSARDRAG